MKLLNITITVVLLVGCAITQRQNSAELHSAGGNANGHKGCSNDFAGCSNKEKGSAVFFSHTGGVPPLQRLQV